VRANSPGDETVERSSGDLEPLSNQHELDGKRSGLRQRDDVKLCLGGIQVEAHGAVFEACDQGVCRASIFLRPTTAGT